MTVMRLKKLFLEKSATCAMWNLSLIKQQNGKLLEGDRIFYRSKCSNFQHISQSAFSVSSFPLMRIWVLFFFVCLFPLCSLSVLFWLRLQSLSVFSPGLLVTVSSLFLRQWLGPVMVAWQAFPREGHSLVLEHLFYFSEHEPELDQSRADHHLEGLFCFVFIWGVGRAEGKVPPTLK